MNLRLSNGQEQDGIQMHPSMGFRGPQFGNAVYDCCSRFLQGAGVSR